MVFDGEAYASGEKLYCRKMLSVTLTFEPVILEMSRVSCGSSHELWQVSW